MLAGSRLSPFQKYPYIMHYFVCCHCANFAHHTFIAQDFRHSTVIKWKIITIIIMMMTCIPVPDFVGIFKDS